MVVASFFAHKAWFQGQIMNENGIIQIDEKSCLRLIIFSKIKI